MSWRIWTLLRKELRSLFATPIAYAVLTASVSVTTSTTISSRTIFCYLNAYFVSFVIGSIYIR